MPYAIIVNGEWHFVRIAICDDDSAYIKRIESVVRTTLAEKNIKARFDLISDSAQLYDSAEAYDMAFLDIGMTPYNGLELAARLKKRNRGIIIFFITSYDNYIDDAMDLRAFRYISKPLDAKRLRAGVEKALALIDKARISFLVKDSEKTVCVFSKDIVFVEIAGRSTRVVTTRGEYNSENGIDFWDSRLAAPSFFRVHKSYIVNVYYATDYSRASVVLCGEYEIPVAYRKQAEFRRFFLN